ncbi:poly(A) polymerase gamma-like [Podarcis muralis]
MSQQSRHYIVLTASSSTEEHHLEWVGLVESKIRVLVGNMERNECIAIAQVNPQSFPGSKEKFKESDFVSVWFLGIIFKKAENAESVCVDLTYDIQSFTDTVYRQANNISLLKEGMKIEAAHVRKKQLHNYLPADVLQKRKKSMPDISQNIGGPVLRSTSADDGCLGRYRDVGVGTQSRALPPFSSMAKPSSSSSKEAERNAVFQSTNIYTNREKPPNVLQPLMSSQEPDSTVADNMAAPSPSTYSISKAVETDVAPTTAHNHQQHLDGVASASVKNISVNKRGHAPALQDGFKRLKDVGTRSLGDTTLVPTSGTLRSQRLSSKELPDSSSPIPASGVRVVKNSIRLTLNR